MSTTLHCRELDAGAGLSARPRADLPSIDVRTAPYAAFVLRLALGIVFVAHALLKLLVFTLPGTGAFFAAHGFPGWTG